MISEESDVPLLSLMTTPLQVIVLLGPMDPCLPDDRKDLINACLEGGCIAFLERWLQNI